MFEKLFRPKTDHPDPAVRLAAIELLSGNNLQNVELLCDLVRHDADARVRSLAIRRIASLDGLASLLPGLEDDELKITANKRLEELLTAGAAIESRAALNIFMHTDSAVAKERLAAHIDDDEALLELIKILDDEVSLAALALKSHSLEVRRKAVEKINTPDVLKTLQHHSRDKNVLQIARQKINALKQQDRKRQQAVETLEKICLAMEKLAACDHEPMMASRLHVLESHWQDVDHASKAQFQQRFQDANRRCNEIVNQAVQQAALEELHASQEQFCQTLCDQFEALISSAGTGTQAFWQYKVEQIKAQWQGVCRDYQPQPRTSERFHVLEGIADKLEGLIVQHQAVCDSIGEAGVADMEIDALEALERTLFGITKSLAWPYTFSQPGLYTQLHDQHAAARNYLSARRKAIKEKTLQIARKAGVLKSHIRQKNLIKANRLFNYIENLLDELPPASQDKERKSLEGVIESLEELRGLNRFITSPKKEQLCQQMETLAASKAGPEKRMAQIKALQDKWKSLATSDAGADDILWDRFKQAADKAYEPCAAWLEQLEKTKHENLQKRKNLCNQLEQEIAGIDWERADWKQVQGLYNQYWKRWRKHEPVFFSENKPVQCEFESSMDQVKNRLDTEKTENHAIYNQLIERAAVLAQVEDAELASSIEQIKRLQLKWKNVGITHFRKREKQWEKFRGHCDTIFERQRGISRGIAKQHDEQANQALDIIGQIEKLALVPDETLTTTGEQFQQLRSQFEVLSDLPEKREKQIRHKFAQACERYQNHVAGLAKRRAYAQHRLVRKAAGLCCAIESLALQSGREQDLTAHKQEFERIDTLDGEIHQHLARRVEQAGQVFVCGAVYPVQELEKNYKALSQIAIELEVLFELDSPDDAKPARMAYQLELLQQGMRPQPTDKQKRQQLHQGEQRWYAIGAIEPEQRTRLESRLKAVIDEADQ